ncbi:monocarboxylate transporter 14-like isoform X1 [Mya arenaria]|uniref:monocarboxylate transporter 14-like isoform X1 n=1 Tax=Mya arenaria TaxID=6604 RepID=UPI0022E5ECB6|nr:monocarboxylate transporter 14-like isoform X1 [Mya arenaria]XP_052802574.1 monocarboxylate transporter 14-like isoform X1 [Mya arenaria]XP_052802576.1 monocarboxylate transporter 14-like isoform X1 [Mya arenaria]
MDFQECSLFAGIFANTFAIVLLWRRPNRILQRINTIDAIKDDTHNNDVIDSENTESKLNNTNNGNNIWSITKFEYTLPFENRKRSLRSSLIKVEQNSTVNKMPMSQSDSDGITVCESLKHLVRSKVFMAYNAGLCFSYPALFIYMIFVVDIFTDKGLSESNATLGLTLSNIISSIARLSAGFLLKIPMIKPLGLPMVANVAGIFGMLTAIYSESLELSIVSLCAIGLSIGLMDTAWSVTTVDLVGVKHLPNAIGLSFVSNAPGNIIAGPISGYIRDQTKTYTVPLYCSAASIFLGLFMYILAQIWKSAEEKKQYSSPIQQSTRM